MKFLLAAIAALCSLCCVPLDLRVAEPNLINPMADATAALVKPSKSHPGMYRPFCTGVWVSDTEILTAAHCVEPDNIDPVAKCIDAPDLFQCIEELEKALSTSAVGLPVLYSTLGDALLAGDQPLGTAREAIVTRYDRVHDLALLLTKEPASHSIAPLSGRDPVPGEVVHMMGHTLGYAWSYSPGVIGATRVTDNPNGDRVHVIQVVAGGSFGNSGGGLFSGHGELLGISSFLIEGAPIMFFTHRDQLARFLQ